MSEKNQKTAMVTGGSRGIGRAICVRLARAGFKIAFNYRSGEEAAEKTRELCEAEGAEVLPLRCDISNGEECEEFIKKAAEFGDGSIEVLVNNAGITRDGLLGRMKEEDFDAVLAVNVKGVFHMLKGVSRLMLKKRYGRIINISSVVGISGNAGQVNYAASKAAVIGMTKSLAKELGSRKITVNAIAPGMIDTEMVEAVSAEEKEKMLSRIPFGEPGKAEDVADLAAFLAGDEARYITGQVICVDGGML